jgi:putative phosphoserine phosphatase/1-acylglycerol-3-phosphate O-acyltransferase
MIAAVFDVDRTLLPGTTAERLFLWYLIRERVLGARAAIETLRFAVLRGGGDPVRAVREHRPYFRGQRAAGMKGLGRRCFQELIRPRLAGDGIERVRFHIAAGHRTVLLSGSLPYILQPMAVELGVDDLICSRLDEVDGRLTGRLVGLHPYGAAKAALIRRFAERERVDLDASFCYADHHSDEGILRLFGHPVCVNPTNRLRGIAQRLSWPVEEFR